MAGNDGKDEILSHINKMHTTANNLFNNLDFNIIWNNLVYDFCHNQH